eukprot:10545320-Lingulodinium_polyedra.AAC.1
MPATITPVNQLMGTTPLLLRATFRAVEIGALELLLGRFFVGRGCLPFGWGGGAWPTGLPPSSASWVLTS